MGTSTTYYEFNKPAGTDLVNPLVDTNPNWDKADTALHELNVRSIANATEVVALGVHALSTLNTDATLLKWTATSNYTAGDTYTINGNLISVATPDGSALVTGSIVSGSTVFGAINSDASLMTIFVSGRATDADKLDGHDSTYFATASDLGTLNGDVTALQNLTGNTSIAGIADGTITGAVSALNTDVEDIQATKIGSFVNVQSQVGANATYIFPQDGYVINEGSSVGACALKSSDDGQLMNVYANQRVFVRKGMKVHTSATSAVYFSGLTT